MHQQQFMVSVDDDYRPPFLQGWDSATSWLGPQFKLDQWPNSLKDLNGMVDIVSLDELSDIPIVETPNGQVTADSS